MSSSRRPTLADVARIAGVSPSTVSRTLKARPGSAAGEVAERIKRVAGELGYRPNVAAAALRSQRSGTIGVVVPRLTQVVMATLYEEIAAACARYGWHALVATAGSPPDEATASEILLERGADGLILSTATLGDPIPKELAEHDVPVVCALRTPGDSQTSAAVCDDHLGGYLATRHLLDLGHRRVAVAGGPQSASSARGRVAGWRSALEEAGIHPDSSLFVETEFWIDSGERAGAQLLSGPERPSAIFAANDDVAIGIISTASRLGISVPRDLSVVGYNDTPMAARLTIPLTTVRVPFREVASSAVDLLNSQLEGGVPRTIVHVPTLIPRHSTAPFA